MSRLATAQVVLKSKSGISADHVVNTFHFLRATEDAAKDDELAEDVERFYNVAGVGGATLASYLAPSVALAGHEVRIYHAGDPAPRVPTHIRTFSIAATAAGAYPRETAMCLSGRGPKVSGTIDARRRGRIYFGPLGSNTGTFDATTGLIRPLASLRSLLCEIGARLASEVNADGWLWGVNSSKGVQPNFTPYTELWVDDAFDTQRRRGEKPTTKTVTPLTQLALAV